MTNTLLSEDPHVSYNDLTELLQEGEMLVAVWRDNFSDNVGAHLVTNEGDHNLIANRAKGGYVRLRWFASTTGSTNYSDYGA